MFVNFRSRILQNPTKLFNIWAWARIIVLWRIRLATWGVVASYWQYRQACSESGYITTKTPLHYIEYAPRRNKYSLMPIYHMHRFMSSVLGGDRFEMSYSSMREICWLNIYTMTYPKKGGHKDCKHIRMHWAIIFDFCSTPSPWENQKGQAWERPILSSPYSNTGKQDKINQVHVLPSLNFHIPLFYMILNNLNYNTTFSITSYASCSSIIFPTSR